jgi:hypothetical protein
MKAPILLKTFSHSVVAAAFSSVVIASKELTEGYNYPASLTADIDFEHGSFSIEGDWHFMMTCNRHAEPAWFDFHKQRVSIEGSIYPGFIIDLSDDNNDGAVFILEGNIKDVNNNISACSGLLVLDKIIENNSLAVDTWNISLYLYDNSNEDCEIALKIPVFVSHAGILSN